jgi:hypothetical protein
MSRYFEYMSLKNRDKTRGISHLCCAVLLQENPWERNCKNIEKTVISEV